MAALAVLSRGSSGDSDGMARYWKSSLSRVLLSLRVTIVISMPTNGHSKAATIAKPTNPSVISTKSKRLHHVL